MGAGRGKKLTSRNSFSWPCGKMHHIYLRRTLTPKAIMRVLLGANADHHRTAGR